MARLIRPLNDMRQELDRLFNEFHEELTLPARFNLEWPTPRMEKAWLPAIELTETESQYQIKAEVPGIKPEDLHVEVMGNTVIIKGESREECNEGDDQKNIYRSEIRYGQFYRQVPLPSKVRAEACKAEFQHGMLTLTLPKQDEDQQQRIKLEIASKS
jgi:HSP20 family protein